MNEKNMDRPLSTKDPNSEKGENTLKQSTDDRNTWVRNGTTMIRKPCKCEAKVTAHRTLKWCQKAILHIMHIMS